MTHTLRTIVLAGLALCAPVAIASYHTFEIDEIYTNASGTVQFVVLRESQGMNGQNQLSGKMLVNTSPAGSPSVAFSHDLPGGACYYGSCMPSPTAHIARSHRDAGIRGARAHHAGLRHAQRLSRAGWRHAQLRRRRRPVDLRAAAGRRGERALSQRADEGQRRIQFQRRFGVGHARGAGGA